MTHSTFAWLIVAVSLFNALVLQHSWPKFNNAADASRDQLEFWVAKIFAAACFIGPVMIAFGAGLIAPWRAF